MHVYLFSKKVIIFLCLIISFVVIFSLAMQESLSFATQFSKDSIISGKSQEEISKLTKSSEKIAYLTFDDGPTLRATGKILDILKEENIKATFFVIGKYVNHHPDLVKRAYDEGHFIANHGYNHNNSKLYQDKQSFLAEVKNTDAEIGNAIGITNYCSHIFRFPNGYISSNYKTKKQKAAKFLSDMGYLYVDWNCLNRDSEGKYTQYQLLQNLKKTTLNKGTLIILMHDTSDVNDTPAILKDSISYLRECGYEFHNFYDLISKEELVY